MYLTSDGAAYLMRSTTGGIYGHPGAATCYATAAADASIPYGQGRAFQSSDVTETFSSDGPHHVFFTTSGAEITPGNRSSSGGMVRQKPILTGSDGVSSYAPNFSPFYGTSAAAPHDAAIAGLVLSANPYLVSQPTQMFSLLTSSGIPIDTAYGALPNRDAGYGILDAYTAVGRAVAAATPTATAQSVTSTQGTPTAITLTGSDPNNRALTYTVVTGPTNGTLSGTAPNLTYTPNAGYYGSDSFTFTVSNGTYTSAPATVGIQVIALTGLAFTSPVPGGTVVTATVTLSGTAPTDTVVGLSSSNSAVVRLFRAVIVPRRQYQRDVHDQHIPKPRHADRDDSGGSGAGSPDAGPDYHRQMMRPHILSLFMPPAKPAGGFFASYSFPPYFYEFWHELCYTILQTLVTGLPLRR